jgi:hypothetical protein
MESSVGPHSVVALAVACDLVAVGLLLQHLAGRPEAAKKAIAQAAAAKALAEAPAASKKTD